jgi:UDP-2,4-diacetamido-2,4,6-trideoxy-beta-L-altropyranose hydrolase
MVGILPAKSTKNRDWHFVFYANASPLIGSGHVMRLLAIAQRCKEYSINLTFAYTACAQTMLERLKREGFACVSLPAAFTQEDIDGLVADAIFVDDYDLTTEQWQVFETTPALLINLDDNINDGPALGDIIINPAADANENDYSARNLSAQLCLGPSYTYLRDEFAKEVCSELASREQVLITLGGADVKNMTFNILVDLLANLPPELHDLKICVLLGSMNTRAKDRLLNICDENMNVSLIEQSEQVATLMNNTGLAVSAAGGTLGELACMGVPTLALVSSDNQESALKSPYLNTWYQAIDVRPFVGPATTQFDDVQNQGQLPAQDRAILATITSQVYELWRDLCRRQKMHNAARQIIDSDGCSRIVKCVLKQLS